MSDKKESTGVMQILIGLFPCGHWKMKVDITWENGEFTEVPVQHCFESEAEAKEKSQAIAQEIITTLIAKGFPFTAKAGHSEMRIRNPHAAKETSPHLH
jgi:hypothetical protein